VEKKTRLLKRESYRMMLSLVSIKCRQQKLPEKAFNKEINIQSTSCDLVPARMKYAGASTVVLVNICLACW